MDNTQRARIAEDIAKEAGALALGYFRDRDALQIDQKGHQDFVSQADKEVELLVRARLADAFPQDGIVGEEHAPVEGTSGFVWVIDPIDGTTNFINAIPAWTVVLAGVSEARTQVGVIYDPCHQESFVAARGAGATLNGASLSVPSSQTLADGSTGVGFSGRVSSEATLTMLRMIFEAGGIFARNASGALSLAYVADGRFLGFIEEHMNAWDCLAGQLIVAEAGGRVEEQDADAMIRNGGRVVVGAPGVFEALMTIADRAIPDAAG